MALVWVRILDPRFADGELTLSLGALTALWGGNDAGKSTTLQVVHDALLDALTFADGESTLSTHASLVAAAVKLTRAESDRLCLNATRRLLQSLKGERWGRPDGQPRVLGREVPRSAVSRSALSALVDGCAAGRSFEAWIHFCSELADVAPGVKRRLVDGIMQRPVILLQRRIDQDRCDEWSVDWLIDSSIQGIAASGDACIPADLFSDYATVLPVPVRAPVPWHEVTSDLRTAAAELGQAILDPEIAEAWIPDREDSLPVVSYALAAYDLVLSAVRGPAFLEKYRLVRSGSDSVEQAEILASRDDGEPFPVDGLAQGFHLWLQLTLRDRIDSLRAAATGLYVVHPGDPMEGPLLRLVAALHHPDPRDIYRARTALDEVGESLLEEHFNPSGFPRDFDVFHRVMTGSPRLYVIDEPERHLHPALQRQAANWAHAFARDRASQILYATHAPALLAVRDEARLTHVRRDQSFRIVLTDLDPRDLSVVDEELQALGLDRGDYLALFRAVLFVEGETDKEVIEAFYGDNKLKDYGILVQPFRGAKGADKIYEAETLMRVLGPPFHLMVDHCDADEVKTIEMMTFADLNAALDAKPKRFIGEAEFLARVRRGALAENREVHIHAIPQRDILGLLSDECIAEELRARGHTKVWPGFSAIASLDDQTYKRTLNEYGITKDPKLFAAIARRTREHQGAPPHLDQILEELWRSTNGLPSTARHTS